MLEIYLINGMQYLYLYNEKCQVLLRKIDNDQNKQRGTPYPWTKLITPKMLILSNRSTDAINSNQSPSRIFFRN